MQKEIEDDYNGVKVIVNSVWLFVYDLKQKWTMLEKRSNRRSLEKKQKLVIVIGMQKLCRIESMDNESKDGDKDI